MAEIIDSIVMEISAIMPTPQANNVAQMLIGHLPSGQGFGACDADIVSGYFLAAARVAEWETHKDWPRLRDNTSKPTAQ